MEQEQQRRTLSIDEVADVLKVGIPTVQSLINRGLLRVHHEEDQDCILYEDVVAFLRADQRRLLVDGAQPSDLGLTSGEESGRA